MDQAVLWPGQPITSLRPPHPHSENLLLASPGQARPAPALSPLTSQASNIFFLTPSPRLGWVRGRSLTTLTMRGRYKRRYLSRRTAGAG